MFTCLVVWGKIFQSQSLLKVYKSYVQSKIDYGQPIWGSTKEVNLDRIQQIQNLGARIILTNFDSLNSGDMFDHWNST